MSGLRGFNRVPGGDARARRNANRLANLITDALGFGLVLVDGQIAIDNAAIDHGGLAGLADDDHLQYLLDNAATGGEGIAVASRAIDLNLPELTADTVADAADVFVFYDAVDAAHKKITTTNLGAAIGGAVDHGALLGLADDDHVQYLLDVAGTGGNGITVASRIVSVDLAANSALGFSSGALTADLAALTVAAAIDPAADLLLMFDADLSVNRKILVGSLPFGPNDAQYITLATDSDLTVERVLTAGNGISLTDGGAGSTLTVAVALASTPGLEFDSSNLRTISRVIDRVTTNVQHINSTAYTTMYSGTVPANVLSTNRTARIRMFGTYTQNTGSARTITVRITWGASTPFTVTSSSIGTNANSGAWTLEVAATNRGATGSQIMSLVMDWSDTGVFDFAANGDIGGAWSTRHFDANFSITSAEDTTSAKTFKVEMTTSVASSNFQITANRALLEIV